MWDDPSHRAVETIEHASAALASQSGFVEATLSSIPDFVYAFDRQRRFAYANPAMLALFGLAPDELLGKTFTELNYPAELADQLTAYIDVILRDGITVEDEVYYRSPSGYAAYFAFVWGPVRARDGSIELVVGVSRDTSERHASEEKLRKSEARLRAATELVGLGIYSWDPISGALEWDERLRAMWGLPPGAEMNMSVFEACIHPDDLPRVRQAIAACVNPLGDGSYNVEYRVIGRDDGKTRHIATAGSTTFSRGRAVGFIGAAMDVTTQRRTEAAIEASEAQFRSFADHSSNVIWIADAKHETVTYRSAAHERIWGVPSSSAPTSFADWLKDVHHEDRKQVEHALATVKGGDLAQVEYRIIRPCDGAIRSLRDTSFPIFDEHGAVTRIGGIIEELTAGNVRQVYIVSSRAGEARRLAGIVLEAGYQVRTFESSLAFLEIAAVLAPGCVLLDLRKARTEGLSTLRELKSRAIALPMIALDAGASVGAAVAAMKAGAVDYLLHIDDASLRGALASAMAQCHGTTRATLPAESAGARVSKLTSREREVLTGLIEGGTNKSIGRKLGISPRTVEMHRAQVMNRLNASSLMELLQIASAAGVPAANDVGHSRRRVHHSDRSRAARR
jgi:PAS domain S-box-containing protein